MRVRGLGILMFGASRPLPIPGSWLRIRACRSYRRHIPCVPCHIPSPATYIPDERVDHDDYYGHGGGGGGGIAIGRSRGATTASQAVAASRGQLASPGHGATMAGQGSAIAAGGSVRGSTTVSQPVSVFRRSRSAGLPGHGATMAGNAGPTTRTMGSSRHGATMAGSAGPTTKTTGSSRRGATTAGQGEQSPSVAGGLTRPASLYQRSGAVSQWNFRAMGLPWPETPALQRQRRAVRAVGLPRPTSLYKS